jgi:hypothetical protein
LIRVHSKLETLAARMEQARLLAKRGFEREPGYRFRIKLRIAPPLLEQLAAAPGFLA